MGRDISCKLARMAWVTQAGWRASHASLCGHLTLLCHRVLTLLPGKTVVWDKYLEYGFFYPKLSIFFPSLT